MAVGAYTHGQMLATTASRWPLPVILLRRRWRPRWRRVVGVAAARLHGPYLAGATLALAVALPGLADRLQGILGGDQGLPVRRPAAGLVRRDLPARALAGLARATSAALITFFLLANLCAAGSGDLAGGARRRGGRGARRHHVGVHAGLAFVVSAASAGLAGGVLVVVRSWPRPAPSP